MVFTFSFCLLHFKQYSLWHRGAVVITSAQLLSTKPERRSCASSSLTCGVSEIRDGEDLWQWSYLMNCFCGMVDRRKAFSFISSRDHCQRSSPSRISDTLSRVWTCAEPEFRLSWMKFCSRDNHYTTAP